MDFLDKKRKIKKIGKVLTHIAVLLLVAVIGGLVSFHYVHYTSYILAESHIEFIEMERPGVFLLIICIAYIIFKKGGAERISKEILVILFFEGLYAFIFSSASCPVCGEVRDKWFILFYEFEKGIPYHPGG